MKSPTALVILLATLTLLTACGEEQADMAGQAGVQPPANVGMVIAKRENLPFVSELPGRITPTRAAEVRPRVGGIIERRVFLQGANVKAGDVLFEIDPKTYEIAVAASRARVARANAVLVEAKQNEKRLKSLQSKNVSSQAALDKAVALTLQSEAELAEAKAELRSAEVQLDYTSVRAPIDGRIGRALVSEGALVQAGGAEVLTTIQQLDPIYADIQQPVSELLRLRRALEEGTLEELAPGVARVRLFLDDGSQYVHDGRLLFSEASVEQTSGQVTMRAEFPNPEGTLLPGMYVRVAVDQALQTDVIAIPDQAIQRDGSGTPHLFVIDEEGKADLRPVRLGPPIGNRYVISRGINDGEQVIVDGIQNIASGSSVNPTPWADPTSLTGN